jgi:NADH-quinone oxidoreductase subunit E
MQVDTSPLRAEQRDHLDAIVSRNRGRPGELLTVLEQVQEAEPSRYLRAAVLDHVGRTMGVPLSRIRSVATFYSFFNLEPQGKHTVCVCRGTACHTRGSGDLLESLRQRLGFGRGGGETEVSMTTPDGKVTIRTVACLGQCALAPVVEIDRSIHGHQNDRTLKSALEAALQEGS